MVLRLLLQPLPETWPDIPPRPTGLRALIARGREAVAAPRAGDLERRMNRAAIQALVLKAYQEKVGEQDDQRGRRGSVPPAHPTCDSGEMRSRQVVDRCGVASPGARADRRRPRESYVPSTLPRLDQDTRRQRAAEQLTLACRPAPGVGEQAGAAGRTARSRHVARLARRTSRRRASATREAPRAPIPRAATVAATTPTSSSHAGVVRDAGHAAELARRSGTAALDLQAPQPGPAISRSSDVTVSVG
ncbi:hypothetical protein H4W81_004928 [Nonomuraea africana]|uniref:Uncharacterized protein n=1 Tax=Nonomuraea africana TaxID=46171 RepID=A0ABR9KJE8_9ACTN|nr:hypothetical protein [Nonomuraea africana]